MQTRRRIHQSDTACHEAGLAQNLSQEQNQQQGQPNPLFGAVPEQLNQNAAATSAAISDEQRRASSIDVDDKYSKAANQTRTWNFPSFSSTFQTTAALRTYIQEPLSAAAAVVTGNYTPPADDEQYAAELNVYGQYTASTNESELNDDSYIEPTVEEVYVMAARDRTGEFSNAIRALQARDINRAVNIRDPRKVKAVQSHSEFMSVAKFVGKNIASTYAKLEKLTHLARKKGLFDDRPQEIQELTYIIKSDLSALNQQIARLQEISKHQRRDNSGKHLISHSSNMVLALQSKLANMSTDFKQILEVRTENLKQQKARREMYGDARPSTILTPTAEERQHSLLLREQNPRAAIAIDMDGVGDATAPLLGPPPQTLQMQQQMALYDQSDSYVHQRAETMHNIESTIVELGGIFQQLATMVKEQEEIVERIDTNIVDAEMNIESAHGEILRYFQSVSKNRWLMIKIFAVLIFFFFFFVIFLT